MKYIIDNNAQDITRSHYIGAVKITYSELVKYFGEPLEGSEDGKIQAHWILKAAGSVYIHIYDYKEDVEPRKVLLWHIGGFHNDALEIFNIILKDLRKNESYK